MPPKDDQEGCKQTVNAVCVWLGFVQELPGTKERLRGFLPTMVDERDKIAKKIAELSTDKGFSPKIIATAIHETLAGRSLGSHAGEDFRLFKQMVKFGKVRYQDVIAKIYEGGWGFDSTEARKMVQHHQISPPPSRHGARASQWQSGRTQLRPISSPPVTTPIQKRHASQVDPFNPQIKITPAYPGEQNRQRSPDFISLSPPPAGTVSNKLPSRPPPTRTPGIQGADPQLDAAERQALAPPVATGTWRYEPQAALPDPEPEEYVSLPLTVSATHVALGARVRGKKHKHDGRGCDDWFEMGTADGWTILAVADGAGSKEFSRVGAEYACKAARDYLQHELRNFKITGLTPQALSRGHDWCFDHAALESLKVFLHCSFAQAHAGLETAARDRDESPDHQKVLGRRPMVDDFACTLLVAAHTVVEMDCKPQDLVIACQVGDGIAAAISNGGSLVLLGEAARGDHAGETAFISDKRRIDPAQLSFRTQVFAGNLRSLVLMTDGVADDYFPNDPDLLRLYADLVLNGIIQLPGGPEGAPAEDRGGNGSEAPRPPYVEELERLLDKETRQKVQIRSAEKYAAHRGVAIGELIKSPQELSALSAAAELGPPMAPPSPGEPLTPEKRLEIWLDSYHVRGSFDDRTLVVLHPISGARQDLPAQDPPADGGGAS